MVASDSGGTIESFRGRFLGEELEFAAGQAHQFTATLPVGAVVAIDFAVVAPEGVPTGTYQGDIDISVQAAGP